MRAQTLRTLAVAAILLACGTLVSALVLGGDVAMITLGLILAGGSMALFQESKPKSDD